MKKKLSGEAVFQIVDILLMCLFIFFNYSTDFYSGYDLFCQ